MSRQRTGPVLKLKMCHHINISAVQTFDQVTMLSAGMRRVQVALEQHLSEVSL